MLDLQTQTVEPTPADEPKVASAPSRGACKKEKAAPDIATTLWAAADKLRGNMDAAEYKHVALGLIFLKYISDRFEERRAQALADPEEADLVEARDLYSGDNLFWVPETARWTFLKANATSLDPTIGVLVDRAMLALEAENPSLRGVLTKNYARPELDQTRLGEVVKLFSDLAFRDAHHGQDVLGRVYEYFLGQFAIAEGKRGGQFYTAGSVVRLLVTAAKSRGEELGLTEQELAFYDALAENGSARELMAHEALRALAQMLVKTIRNSASIDWTRKNSVRAKMRIEVRKLLARYGYPPDLQLIAVDLVILQAESLAVEWTAT